MLKGHPGFGKYSTGISRFADYAMIKGKCIDHEHVVCVLFRMIVKLVFVSLNFTHEFCEASFKLRQCYIIKFINNRV